MEVEVAGAELFCTERGQGPVVLVLCSLGTSSHQRTMPSALDQRLRLVFVDLRGSGRSTGAASDVTWDVLVADLEAVRAALGVERVAVLGHSILGALAIEYGARAPGAVSHVIAVGAPPVGNMAALAAQQTAFFERDASEERKRLLAENLGKLAPGASFSELLIAQTPMRYWDPRFDAASVLHDADARPDLVRHLMASLLPTWEVRTRSSSLGVPIFLAQGRYDYIVPHVLWDEIADTLPSATLRRFERSGHQPFLEEPEEFATAVAIWMAGQDAGWMAGKDASWMADS